MSGVRHCVIALCCVFCVLLTASGHYIASKRSDQGVSLSTFKVTTVSQELTDNGYRIRLQVNGSRLPRVYRLKDYHTQPEQLPIGSAGDVEFYNNASDVNIVLLHPRGFHHLELHLNNASMAEQILPDVQFTMQGGNEITFEEGNEADANITLRVDNNQGSRFSIHRAFVMKSKTEEHIVDKMYSDHPSPVRLLEEGDSESESILHLRVNTTSGDVEGLLVIDAYIRLEFGEEGVCLGGYSIHEDIPVYQNDHAGPFPEHFIGLQQLSGEEISDQDYCSVHDSYPCFIECTVYGDHPSPVEFVRVDNGAGQLNPIARLSISNDGFWAVGQLVFGNVSLGDRAEYQCSSQSGREVISHTIKLMVIQEARITGSPVNRLDDGTVEASCLAEGTPAPTLTFYFRNDTAMNDINSDAFEIVVMPSRGPTSEAVLRISDPKVANETRNVRCEAVNVIEGKTFRDSVRIYVAERISDGEYPDSVRYYLENYVEDVEG